MIRYIKQSGKPDPDGRLTFADLKYQPDNDWPEARRWRRNVAIGAGFLGAAILLIPLSLNLS